MHFVLVVIPGVEMMLKSTLMNLYLILKSHDFINCAFY
jgi:hypothetical protein